jgi:hypothetical protein
MAKDRAPWVRANTERVCTSAAILSTQILPVKLTRVLTLLTCIQEVLRTLFSRVIRHDHFLSLQVKVKITLRPTVNRPVYLCIRHLSGPNEQTFITVRQLWFCWYGVPSLTRGRVCILELLLGLTSAVILGFESRRTHDHILLFQIWDFPNLEGQVLVFISPRSRVSQIHPPPRHWHPLLGASLLTAFTRRHSLILS